MQGNTESGIGEQPPIVIKKVSGHGGHHGGAWKVAFADFVTAMMALFMVLWLMNANQEQKEAVSAYFKDPQGVGDKLGSGQSGSGTGMSVAKDDVAGLADRIEEAMKGLPQFDTLKEQIEMTVTGEGLRIELLETEKGTFFETGHPTPTAPGKEMLTLIAEELNKLPNRVIIEGHTDARPFRGRNDYSNWELSTDRANSARRILLESGLPLERVVQVRGFADVQLRKKDEPEDPSNRRISLIVEYTGPPPTESTHEDPPEGAVHEAPAPVVLPPLNPAPQQQAREESAGGH